MLLNWIKINFISFLIPKDIHIMLKLVVRAEYNTYKVTIGLDTRLIDEPPFGIIWFISKG